MNKWLVLLALLLSVTRLDGQICNGSLGDPIINITFGSGINPGQPLTAATTNYQYVATDCPNDGFYALRNSTNSCFGNTWHSITDHTGNTNGYFMLVNASLAPSAFYLDTVKGLCGNTTYEFAAWILNVLKPTSCGGAGIEPDLTFRIEKIDGTVLQSYNTNKIAATNAPQWNQYGFFFTTPASATDVVLRIVNNSQGGCGNDLALDDITFRPCGPQISASIAGTTATFVSLCEGSEQTYSFNGNVSAGFNNPVVQWQQSFNGAAWSDVAGATSLAFSKLFTSTTAPGNYSYRLAAAEAGNMSSAQCRIASTPLVIQVSANPLVMATSNSPVCEGSAVVLNATGNTIVWSGPSGFTGSGTQISINDAGQQHGGRYYATAVNGACNRMDSTNVTVIPNPVVSTNATEIQVCEGDTAMLTATGATAYRWSPPSGLSATTGSTVIARPVDSIVYSVIGYNNNCSDTVTITVNVVSKPKADAGADKSLMEGNSIQLAGSVSGDSVMYYWSPAQDINDIHSLTPYVSPSSNVFYILHVVSVQGCGVAVDTVEVHVYKKLIIPNAFSPNNDGLNDKWNIGAIESYPGARVSVFDRFGRLVFSTERFTGWNGKQKERGLPMGTYYYHIDLRTGTVLSGWLLMLY